MNEKSVVQSSTWTLSAILFVFIETLPGSTKPIGLITVADRGFHRGVANRKGGVPTYYLAKICRKLHKHERDWTEAQV